MRGGECLSQEYFGASKRLWFRCANGHEWETQPSNIRNGGNWCPYCAGKVPHTLEMMKQLAASHGGRCLSSEYKHAHSKLWWCCSRGHEWEATASSVRNHGTWCPICCYDKVASDQSLGLEEMRALARERGGECLSTEYPRGRKKRIRWRCGEGHEWESAPAAVKHSGQWCPTCSSGLGERFCRGMFEAVFGEAFPKARPDWLRNSRGNRMELDGYCQKLRLAFEYHGIQHYKTTTFFDQKSPLQKRIQDDAKKRHLCQKNGVALFEIPYTIERSSLQQCIYDKCAAFDITVGQRPPIDLAKINYYPKRRLEEMRSFAASRGGECLATHYVTMSTPVTWRCSQGHTWDCEFHYIKNKRQWCPECAGNKKLTLDEIHAMARQQGGECLATEYRQIGEPLLFRCAKGHEWKVRPLDIKHKHSWCPYCAGVARLSLEAAQSVAIERGGECLSMEYVHSKAPLLWRCEKGHEWKNSLNGVRNQKQWCPYCAEKAKLTIELMRDIAISRGGACLSEVYVNTGTKLMWRCARGHEWMATPDNVKNRGTWCPACARSRLTGNQPRMLEQMK
jgi:hypothetical protein